MTIPFALLHPTVYPSFRPVADKCAIIPKGYYSDEAYLSTIQLLGPFRWLEYKQDDYLKFEAVPNHWRKLRYQILDYTLRARASTGYMLNREADIISLAANISAINDPLLNLVGLKMFPWSIYPTVI